ncbi:DNA (cytosine-5-)-methyltransferase [Paraliobacillus ryukyuensis]|nr:DNA (cytosine-5-)-methyltransferase [Paraliobacillus ryukyuensis]
MKFLDLFSGIGGFRLGMEQAGHESVGYVEIDKFARKSYESIFATKGEWTANDITTISDDDIRCIRDKGRIEIICGGFPCQAFSVAGKRGGFDDARGTLFFEIARIANIIRPRYLFLENVKGLLSHDKGITFETILRTMDEIGYDAEWQVLNSKDFGVPQNRERVFIIGHLRGGGTRKIFPIESEINEHSTFEKSTEAAVARTFTAGGNSAGNHSGMTMIKLAGHLDIKGQENIRRVYDTGGISPSLTTMEGGNRQPKIYQSVLTPERENKRQNGRRIKDPNEPMFTLTSQDRHGVSDGYRIRKLTPRECWRLQGFPDWAFDKAKEVNSDSQLYKQAGNSVTVNVIYAIAKKLG